MIVPQNGRVIEIVLAVFGDESHDEKKERVFAVGGLFGSKDEWDAFEIVWLRRTGGKIFHANECDTDEGDYKNTGHEANKKLYADLTRLIAKSNFMGHTAVVDLQEYRAAFRSDLPDEPYYWCFSDVIKAMGEMAYLHVPRDIVEFTFDQNTYREYNAGAFYNWIINDSAWMAKDLLADKVSFACRKTVGIQAADLIAREGMKNLDNQVGPIKRDTRRSMKTLAATKRFHFEYYRRPDFERKKKEAAVGTFAGKGIPAYREWLARKGLVDCMSNRIEWLRR